MNQMMEGKILNMSDIEINPPITTEVFNKKSGKEWYWDNISKTPEDEMLRQKSLTKSYLRYAFIGSGVALLVAMVAYGVRKDRPLVA